MTDMGRDRSGSAVLDGFSVFRPAVMIQIR
jgi:hypothetical protein